MRVLFFAATLCLLALFGVTNSYPTEEVQAVEVAEPVAVEEVPAAPYDTAAVAPEDAVTLDENGRPKRQFVAGLITGALLAGGQRPYYGYGYGRPHGYGSGYGHYHRPRPYYGGYGYGGYGGYYGK